MKSEALHAPSDLAHHRFGPLVVATIRAAGDLVDPVVAEVTHVRGITLVLVGVIFRSHVPAAAPVLVAHAEILQLPRLLTAIPPALVGHGADVSRGHVLDPLLHLLNRTAAQVAANVR